jgi:glycosyltransferase involved in cell wall biosynthesis
MQLAVVTIGRNEGERLRRCLQSVPAGIPIVYVDSGSNDGSVNLAQALNAEVVQLDLARPFTAARARNEGLSRVLERWPDTRLVQFVDGDCEIERGWIERASAFLRENAAAGAVCGRRRERHPDASFYNGLCDREWDTPVGQAHSCGGDALVKIDALREVGGYDPALTAGEEPELCARLRSRGWTIWRLDAPMTIHDAAMYRFRQWWLRAVRSGYGYAQVWHKTSGRSSSPALYTRELSRAFGWTAGIAILGVLLCMAIGPAGVVLPIFLWTAQFARLSHLTGPRTAAHLMVGKMAETLGALKYGWALLTRRREDAIFYK